jgi:3-ketosteroid 9alpha-monooxygenase subunit B
MRTAHTLQVVEAIPEGRDSILLSFALQDEQLQLFRFDPGQYLTLAADIDGDMHWRCYSITSEPRRNQLISVLVKRMPGGRVSNWICDNVQPGSRIAVLPPAGRFLLARPPQSVLLFAGGSGIAPVFALARQALEEGASRVSLFYANRDRSATMLLPGLNELRRRWPGKLEMRLWFDVEDGLPTVDAIRRHAGGFEDGNAYLCGPEPFMKATNAALEQVGLDRRRVHQEDFGAAAGETENRLEPGAESSLTVVLNGKEHIVSVTGKQTLLSAMLNSGLVVPHACKVGECASCICRLEQGEVERLENSVLDEDDVANNLLLACRARAISERVTVRFW